MLRTIKELISHTPPPESNTEFNKKYEGSGAKEFNNPKISAGDYWLLSFASRPYLGQFVPLDFAKIVNQSTNDILVKLNQEDRNTVPIPAGSSETIQIGKFHDLQIVNLESTSIPASEIQATVMKTPRSEQDDYIREQRKMAGLK